MNNSENFYLKELRSYNRKLLCFFRHKNKRKHYQRSDVPFFMINLHFSILNYRTTHRKTNLLLIRNIHLGQSIQEWTKLNFLKTVPQILLDPFLNTLFHLVFSSLEIQKRLMQTKVFHKFFYLV